MNTSRIAIITYLLCAVISRLFFVTQDMMTNMLTSQATKIGVTVNAYKKSSNSKVAQYAKQVVSKWKKLMQA